MSEIRSQGTGPHSTSDRSDLLVAILLFATLAAAIVALAVVSAAAH